MEIIPVMDVREGEVVHGRQVDRADYPPIGEVSEVVDSSRPPDVADTFGARRVYVADLDALEGAGDNFSIVEGLSSGRDVLLDPGISSLEDLEKARSIVRHPVLGTETCPEGVMESCVGNEFVSLDVEDGLPEAAGTLDRLDLAGVIVLSLGKVGTASGVDLGLVEEVLGCGHPVYVGGGIASEDDLVGLEEAGAAGALVSTALHDGSISLDQVPGPID